MFIHYLAYHNIRSFCISRLLFAVLPILLGVEVRDVPAKTGQLVTARRPRKVTAMRPGKALHLSEFAQSLSAPRKASTGGEEASLGRSPRESERWLGRQPVSNPMLSVTLLPSLLQPAHRL